MHPEILRQQEKLRHLFEQAEQLQQIDGVDDEIRAQFVWYLCVRTSGYVETSIRTILNEYVSSQTSSASIISFIDERVQHSRRMRFNEIATLVGRFSSEWEKRLRDSTPEDPKHSLGNIVTNRNNIAHGYDVNVSLRDLGKWFEDAQEVVELVYSECS